MKAVKIKVFTTGGSMDKTYSPLTSAFEVGPPQAGLLLGEANLTVDVESEAVCAKDSLDLTEGDRRALAEAVKREPCRHVVITHGTDTMALTARALGDVGQKVVVLTGAMRPAAFRDSDAPFNLGFALAAVQLLPPGVHIALHGRILDPLKTVKSSTKDRLEEVG